MIGHRDYSTILKQLHALVACGVPIAEAADALAEAADRPALAVLPKGFHRIRHYGLLASPRCKANIARVRELIAAPIPEGAPAAAQDTQSGRRARSSPAMPLLRWPHDDRRGIWARRRTARPALWRRERNLSR